MHTEKISPSSAVPVLGVGASAGGLDAFELFLSGLPEGLRYAVVLLQHLDPRRESTLADILSRHAHIPGLQTLKDGMQPEAGALYVLPANTILRLVDGRFLLEPPRNREDLRGLIDTFFCSLADELGDLCAGAILAGDGTDGSRGLAAIMAAGGYTLVQDPATASHSSMPLSASSYAAEALSPELMGQALLQFSAAAGFPDDVPPGTGQEADLSSIFAQVKELSGVDLSLYKRTTVRRRLERRIVDTHSADATAYREKVEAGSEEARQLLANVLIGVTSFFRDRDAFDHIAQTVLPPLLARSAAESRSLRIWVPACSTGEEVYSFAILCLEAMLLSGDMVPLQLFATDLDASAIETARRGLYTEEAVAGVDPELLQRYFEKASGGYRVTKVVRTSVVFAQHNILSDPPYSRLDGVSCRNLMIYLRPEAQRSMLVLFAYALRVGGFLFLGSAESASVAGRSFSIHDKKHKIYYRTQDEQVTAPPLRFFPVREQKDVDMSPSSPPSLRGLASRDLVHRLVLEHFVPAAVLVGPTGDIVYLQGDVDQWLTRRSGRPSDNIVDNVLDSLRISLANALRTAVREGTEHVTGRLRVAADSDRFVRLSVLPAGVEGQYLVVFEPVEILSVGEGTNCVPETGEGNRRISELEIELSETQQFLRSTIEELENANEELTASNEEAQSVNEELQSANEELESSKEELQAANEELSTLNGEYAARIEELSRLNNDVHNFVRSSQLGMIFLDRKLSLVRYTPAIAGVLPLQDADIGRPIAAVSSRIAEWSVAVDAEKVLSSLQVLEKEVVACDGRWYLQRMLPYRTVEDRIEGVVITFTDITEQRLITDALRASEEQYRDLFDNMVSGFALHEIICDESGTPVDYRFLSINPAFERLTGFSAANMVGRTVREAMPQTEDYWIRTYGKVALTQEATTIENYAGEIDKWYRSFAYSPRKGQFAVVFSDITEQKKAEAALRQNEARFRALFETMSEGVVYQDDNGRIIDANSAAERLLGLSRDQLLGKTSTDPSWHCIRDDGTLLAGSEHPAMVALSTGKPVRNMIMGIAVPEEDAFRWTLVSATPEFRTGESSPYRVYATITDISGLRASQDQLRKSEELHRSTLESIDDLVFVLDTDSVFIDFFQPELTGDLFVPPEMFIGKPIAEVGLPAEVRDAFLNAIELLHERGGVQSFDYTLPMHGSIQHFNARLSKRLTPEGAYAGVTIVSRNITARVTVEAALRESEELHRLAQKVSHLGHWILSFEGEGNRLFWSDEIYRIFELEKTEFGATYEAFLNTIHPDDRDAVNEAYRNSLTSRTTYQIDHRLRMKDGRVKWVREQCQSDFDAAGAPLRSIGIVQDITEQRRMEETLGNAQRLESLGVLAGGIAHDFNNLLGGLFGYLDLARELSDPAGKPSHYLGCAMGAFTRAKDLTSQLLTFSKGGMPIKKVIEISSLIQHSVRFVLSGSNVNVAFDLAPDLRSVEVDENQFGQVIDNLVINARQAMVAGGTITITAQNISAGSALLPAILEKADYVRVSVADSGAGIARSILPRIFDPFFSTKAEGSGLGLATAYSIMTKHGGSISVESTEGVGSVFHLYLPAVGAADVASTAPAASEHRGRGRVLIVDDEPFICEIGSTMLESMGYEASCAVDGVEALALFRDASEAGRSFDLVLLDLTVPGGMGGVETLAKLKLLDPTVRAVASSGYSSDPVMADPPAFGFTGAIAKPYRRADLAALLERVFEG